jgi:hypothetical protein
MAKHYSFDDDAVFINAANLDIEKLSMEDDEIVIFSSEDESTLENKYSKNSSSNNKTSLSIKNKIPVISKIHNKSVEVNPINENTTFNKKDKIDYINAKELDSVIRESERLRSSLTLGNSNDFEDLHNSNEFNDPNNNSFIDDNSIDDIVYNSTSEDFENNFDDILVGINKDKMNNYKKDVIEISESSSNADSETVNLSYEEDDFIF